MLTSSNLVMIQDCHWTYGLFFAVKGRLASVPCQYSDLSYRC
jgi:hypothetical protein